GLSRRPEKRAQRKTDQGGRDKPGHDSAGKCFQYQRNLASAAFGQPRRTTYIRISTCARFRPARCLPFLLAGKGREEDRTGLKRPVAGTRFHRENTPSRERFIARTLHRENTSSREHFIARTPCRENTMLREHNVARASRRENTERRLNFDQGRVPHPG